MTLAHTGAPLPDAASAVLSLTSSRMGRRCGLSGSWGQDGT